MRGADLKQEAMSSHVSREERIPAQHPLQPIRDDLRDAGADG